MSTDYVNTKVQHEFGDNKKSHIYRYYVVGGNSNFVNSSNPVFNRGNNGFFGYNNNNGNANSNNGARAVVVCGAGLLQITI